MTNYKVKSNPQDTEWHQSFNVLVPLCIQGKECAVIEFGNPSTRTSGSTSTIIRVEGKQYAVPSWAIEFETKVYFVS